MQGWDVGRLLPGAAVDQPCIQNRMLIEKAFYMYYEMFVCFHIFQALQDVSLIGYSIYSFFNERCKMYKLHTYTPPQAVIFGHNSQVK